jgi:hypothetical protein
MKKIRAKAPKGGERMGIVGIEDVIGLRVEDKIFCVHCAEDEEWLDTYDEYVIFRDDTVEPGTFVFCDRCGKLIIAKK